jgi:antitoxin component YwqK of YwqJK toxin-antitoxin module
LKRRCAFKAGIRQGMDEMWSEEGILLDQGAYHQGKPVGIHRRWAGNGQLIEEIDYFEPNRFNLRRWDESGVLRVEALWSGDVYREKSWDRFENCWIDKVGHWDGKKIVYRD